MFGLSWPSSFWARHLFAFPLLPGMHTPWSLALLSPQAISSLPTTFKRWLHSLFNFNPCCQSLWDLFPDQGLKLGPWQSRVQSHNHWPSENSSGPFQWWVIEALFTWTPSCTSFFDTWLHIASYIFPVFLPARLGELSLAPSYKLTILLLWNLTSYFPCEQTFTYRLHPYLINFFLSMNFHSPFRSNSPWLCAHLCTSSTSLCLLEIHLSQLLPTSSFLYHVILFSTEFSSTSCLELHD